MAEQQPIIIKKINKGGHAHHGGAWKLAYADFVTAMMAFFLLMWLLGSTDETTRKGIAEFFADPYRVSISGGKSAAERTSMIEGGGADMVSSDDGQLKTGTTIDDTETSEEQIEKKAEEIEKVKLEALKEKIQDKLNETPELNEFKDQIKLEITSEGLRILIVDDQKRPMYKLASAQTEPHVRVILRALAPAINELPNRVSLNGHTDALPFPSNQKGYTNWELSSDRANAARYELVEGGLDENKVLRVIGLSSSIPYSPTTDPLNPVNRRISIIVMNKKTEQQILQGSSAE
jgi:chemotaxis protein MotB